MTLTLRARLAAISAVVFGLLLVTLGVLSYQVLARRLDTDVTERLTQLTDGLHGYLHLKGEVASVEFDPQDNDQATFIHEATRYYQVYDLSTGRLLAESNGLAPWGLRLTPVEVQAARARLAPLDVSTEYGRLRVSNSVSATSDGRAYLLRVGVSLVTLDAALRRYRDLLIWFVPISLLCAVFLAWRLSGFALRPLSRMAAATREIEVQTLDRRLPVRGVGDELDQVAEAFNETLGRLEHAVGEMRQFSGALAHELRTPLAALRGEIELAMRVPGTGEAQKQAFGSQMEEIDRLTLLMDRILTLARAESGQIRLSRAPVNVSDLAAAVVEQLEVLAEARSIDLRCEPGEGVMVDGDAGWLRRLLLNLLDNALKFTREKGHVVLRVSQEGESARIDVEDTGIGLSPTDAQQVFERFFRADAARPSGAEGAGLGLSLVKWIATQHQGTVTVHSRLGEGSTFTVKLPLRCG